MFDQMRALGALTNLMKDRQKLADAAARVKERLDAARVQGSAGEGAIVVTMSGAMKVVSVHIEPAMATAFSADHASQLLAQDLIAQATNDAMAKAQALARDTVAEEARELGLPEELTSQMGGPFSSALGL
ncbi:MAG: YbaB/EbfC family nucleoid-associated protein [Phycisphaerales bacterium JB060]